MELNKGKGSIFWRYYAEEEQLCTLELGQYGTYGLVAEVKDMSEWHMAGLIHDVTSDVGIARQMARQFTEHQLSCVHFMDAVEDMLP